MLDPDSEEPLLTLDQAYVAAWYFVLQFYERDGPKPESMSFLLNWMWPPGSATTQWASRPMRPPPKP